MEEPESVEIIRRQSREIGRPMDVNEVIRRAEVIADLQDKIKQVALTKTKEGDWMQMGDKAYLTASGAKKVCAFLGASLVQRGIQVEERTIGGEPVTTFTATVALIHRDREIMEIGVCDSNFPFYSSRDKKKIPYSERNFAAMRKHAVTNAISRALKTAFGLDAITWGEFRAALGERTANVGKVEYGTKKAVSPPPQGGTPVAPPPDPEFELPLAGSYVEAEPPRGTGNKREDLMNMAMDLAGSDPELAAQLIERESSFVGKRDGAIVKGFRDPYSKSISEDRIDVTHRKIRRIWLPTFGGPPEEPGANG